jgi:hypothetical protein
MASMRRRGNFGTGSIVTPKPGYPLAGQGMAMMSVDLLAGHG